MSPESSNIEDLADIKVGDNNKTETPKQFILASSIKDLGTKIRSAKAEKKDRAEWDPLLKEMLEAKAEYRKLTGEDYDVPPSKNKKKIAKTLQNEASPSDILSDDLLGSVFEFLEPWQFRFVAGTSRQFKRVYATVSNNSTSTSIERVAESISRSRFYFFEETTHMGPNPRRRKVSRLKRRMQKNIVGRINNVLEESEESGNQAVFEHAMKIKASAAVVQYKRSYECTDCEHTNIFQPYHTCGPKLSVAVDNGDEEIRRCRNTSDLVGQKGMARFGKRNPKWHPGVVKRDNEDGTIKVQWLEDKKFTKRLPVEKFRLLDEADNIDRYDFYCAHCSKLIVVDKMPFNEIVSVLVALRGDFCICPSCGNVVVKNGGCDHIACRCGADFSYDTGRFC